MRRACTAPRQANSKEIKELAKYSADAKPRFLFYRDGEVMEAIEGVNAPSISRHVEYAQCCIPALPPPPISAVAPDCCRAWPASVSTSAFDPDSTSDSDSDCLAPPAAPPYPSLHVAPGHPSPSTRPPHPPTRSPLGPGLLLSDVSMSIARRAWSRRWRWPRRRATRKTTEARTKGKAQRALMGHT